MRATDVFSNLDPTPARRTVTVLRPPPVVHETTIVQQVVVVTLTFTFKDAGKRTTKVGKVTVNSVPSGSTVTAVCPKGCAKKKLVKRNVSGNVSLTQLTGKKPLKAKTQDHRHDLQAGRGVGGQGDGDPEEQGADGQELLPAAGCQETPLVRLSAGRVVADGDPRRAADRRARR